MDKQKLLKKETKSNFFQEFSMTKEPSNRQLFLSSTCKVAFETNRNITAMLVNDKELQFTWTRLRGHVHVWRILLHNCNRYYWNPGIHFKVSDNYLAHWPKWMTQSCLDCSLQHTGTLHLLPNPRFWMLAYLKSLVHCHCERTQRKN